MAEVTFGAVCMRCEHDPSRNLGRYREFISEAAERGVEVLVFPEVSVQGYVRKMIGYRSPETAEQLRYYMETAEPVPGPTTEAIGQLAARHRMYIQIGIAELAGTTMYNTAALIGPDGKLVGKFRKVHNQPEMPVFSPGRGFDVLDTDIARFGPIICADLLFPESVRILGLKGAEVVLMSTAWPMYTDDPETDQSGYEYDLLSRTQAMMNQVWLVSANQVGRSSSPRAANYYGHSRIVGPDGRIVAELGLEEGLVVASADIKEGLHRTRSEDPIGHGRRRPELYGRITALD